MPVNASSIDSINKADPSQTFTSYGGISFQLTRRELEVLDLVVEGCTNTQIANTLYISSNTVKTHVRSIYNKLGVDNRIQTAIFALRNGIV